MGLFTLGDALIQTFQGTVERKRLRETFGRYVDPRIRDKILSGSIPSDGEFREVTILFADLRNFARLTASCPPKTVVATLNAYFKAMNQAIRNCNGLILQFLGDEIYAVFGAPAQSTTHPGDAVRAALDMDRALETLNETLATNGMPVLAHGIGIHTGEVVAANIGSPDRLSYLLVGDTVNLASRLQELTRELTTSLIVSQKTLSLLPDNGKSTGLVPLKKPVLPKGCSQPIKICIKPRTSGVTPDIQDRDWHLKGWRRTLSRLFCNDNQARDLSRFRVSSRAREMFFLLWPRVTRTLSFFKN